MGERFYVPTVTHCNLQKSVLWLSPSSGQLQEMLHKLDLALLLELSILLVDLPLVLTTDKNDVGLDIGYTRQYALY